jgi:hypothetical protein
MTLNTRDFSEKRDFIRMQIGTESTIFHQGQSYSATCVDLSSTGALLTSQTQLEVGEKIILEVNSGGGGTAPLQAEATVLRVSQTDGDQYQYGVGIDSFI